ncbi:hypothetical protein [Caloramator sp. Dgby_cultured_2]|uniref:hypothetical protein n=1 Tax=Caloramator sp. Dgby_cultured_2 TaxID=3029174 RepID=UPI00237EA64E|nr:hypothetical protein [Caloramator sp. Dgby_cultured_2]WDU84290.1 hypothetical protein PWK10_08320 [Caloramator sp. Dgby_cultured_2]
MRKGFIVARTIVIAGIVSILLMSFINLNNKMLNNIFKADEIEYMLNTCRSIVELYKSEEERIGPVEVIVPFDDFEELKSEILLFGVRNFLNLNFNVQENKRYQLMIKVFNNYGFEIFKIKCKGIRGEVELFMLNHYEKQRLLVN